MAVKTIRSLGLVAVLALAAGCAGSPPTRYFTLDMTPSGTCRPRFNLTVDRLRPSEALSRREILVKKTATEVEYYASDEWVAGVDDLVREKLESEFGPAVEGRATIAVSGTILAFEQVDTAQGARTHIKLRLAFHKPGASRYEEPFLRKVYETGDPAKEATPKALAEALSQGLERLAAEIVSDANALQIDGSG